MAAVPLDQDLFSIAILIDELKHTELSCRLNSMRKLSHLATALGPERTRTELVPYVGEGVDDDDEVLLVLAEQLGGLVEAVGGAAHAHVLLEPLEALASVEEFTVRDRAVASLNAVVCSLPPASVLAHAWPLTRRLGDKHWFTARASACALLPRVMSRLPEAGPDAGAREEAFALYARLCSTEEVAVVRRAGASELAAMATVGAGGTLPLPTTTAAAAAAAATSAPTATLMDASTLLLALGTDVDCLPAPSSPPLLITCASPAAGLAAATRLLPLARAFTQDEQDGVRLLAINAVIALARLANGGMGASASASASASSSVRTECAALCSTLAGDRAWRVRWSVAHRLGEVGEALGPALLGSAVLPVLEALLRDGEAEVRCAAAYRVRDMGLLAGRELAASRLMPCVREVVGDGSEHVRAALASVLLELGAVLDEEAALAHLVPAFLALIKDRSPQVRLNIIAKLGTAGSKVSVKSLSASLLPSIQELFQDRAWRVRLTTVTFLPLVAGLLGAEFVGGSSGSSGSSDVIELMMAGLSDSVYSIREAAAGNLGRLVGTFGGAWAEAVILPRVLALIEAGGRAGAARPGGAAGFQEGLASTVPSSQLRLTGLMALVTLGEAVGRELCGARVLPAVLALAGDGVPNVRFSAAKALGLLVRCLEPGVVAARVRPVVAKLREDSDADVRYFAGKVAV